MTQALHRSVYNGNVGTVKTLLTESEINAEALNGK